MSITDELYEEQFRKVCCCCGAAFVAKPELYPDGGYCPHCGKHLFFGIGEETRSAAILPFKTPGDPMPPLPSASPEFEPSFACVNCGGFNVSERMWQRVNPPPGYHPGQSLLDNDAYEAVANLDASNQYYCHDCDDVFDDIKRLDH